MTPYIVQVVLPEESFGSYDSPSHAPEHVISRRAVATLDEARAIAHNALLKQDAEHPDTLTESGGTVSLPDGTVIEVEPRSIKQMLVSDLNYAPWKPQDEASILAAYNEGQGGGVSA